MGKRSNNVQKRYVYPFRQKDLLRKHLQKTRFKISQALSDAVLEEETRSKEEIINDLKPVITPRFVYPLKKYLTKGKSGNKNKDKNTQDIKTENLSPTSQTSKSSISFIPLSSSTQSHIPFLNLLDNTLQSSNKNNKTEDGKDETVENGHPLENPKPPKKKKLAGSLEFQLPTISELEESGLREFYNSFLNSATWQISNLNVKPGDKHFIFWFFVSSYIPLLASCSGPLSNVFSLLAIICPWKILKVDPGAEKDPVWCYAINSVSIVFAIFSNLFLLLNYRKKIRYTYAQIISIAGWGIACTLLTILIIYYHYWFYKYDYDKDYLMGDGFFYACITVVLHFANFFMLTINELGFLLKKYKPVFNIDNTQETLIIQTTAIGVWLMIGASVFTRLIDARLTDSFLYAVTSLITVGMQTLVPVNDPAAQTLTSIWIICGLVMFGLIISSIRQMLIGFSSSTLYWHRLENLRKNVIHMNRELPSNLYSFNLMEKLHKLAYSIQSIYELTTSIITFMITLMCGAIGFSFFEGWDYKSSVYFCFFNLMTLGQGTQVPSTPAGKAFFNSWALGAVPVMTILVSTSSDFIFSKLTYFEKIAFFDGFVEYCLSQPSLYRIGKFLEKREYKKLNMKSVALYRTKSKLILKNPESLDTRDFAKDLNSRLRKHEEEIYNMGSSPTEEDIKMGNIPVSCHPADMLYSILMDTDKIKDLNFITSDNFFKSNMATIHLANYFRDGQYVDVDKEELNTNRDKLTRDIKSIDQNFNTEEFKRLYNINKTLDENGIDEVSVVQPNNKIRTYFKKKNDYVLNKLSKMQIILIELKYSALHMCIKSDYHYTYEDWINLFEITKNSEGINDPSYWVESRSPLAIKMNQPSYFTLHYLRHLELFVQQFAEEWDSIKDKTIV